jgi:Flp pilus assembly CpaF family ATPase
VLQSGIEMPYRAIKTNIADSLDVIVQIERRPGKRFVSHVVEIASYNPETDIYHLRSIHCHQDVRCGAAVVSEEA